MEEKNEKLDGGDVRINIPLSKKLENFWYHYKWHTIVTVVVLIMGVILVMQTCSRVETDAYIIYAGPHTISRVGENGNISEYENAVSSLKKITQDYTDDGVVSIALADLFVVNSEEAEKLLEANPGKEINAALVKENTDTLHQKLLFGEYYLCFLSERLFLEYEEEYGAAMFADVKQYEKEGAEYEYASERGIYLRSLPFASLPEICDLPDDTVVCLRRFSEVASTIGRADNEENFKRGEDMMKKLLSYGITTKIK